MPIDEARVREVFAPLTRGEGDAFFAHVADDVDWTVTGRQPLSGRYRGKAEFRRATFARLGAVMDGPLALSLEHVLVSGDWATVELKSHGQAKNGEPFENDYCWVVRFDGDRIVEVRAYLDSLLVARTLEANEGAG